jgi:hypothetical protein
MFSIEVPLVSGALGLDGREHDPLPVVDGRADLAVIFTCMTGIGPTVAQELPMGEVWLARGGGLAPDPRITKAVAAKAPKTVKRLLAVARAALAGR